MADNRKFPSVLAKRLKTDISATDTAFKLPDIKWYTGSDGVDVNLASTDFGTVAYGVFEPNTSRQEFFTWDPTTIASYASSGITILARGLPWSADYTTEASSRKWGHDGGTKVLLMTNAPAFYDQFTNKNNDETIAGTWTFTSTARPKYDTHPTFVADEELIDKKYADDLAISGSPDMSTTVKGIGEEATLAELNAGTPAGGTTARLVANPSTLHQSRLTNNYAADAGSTDAYAITSTVPLTALVAGKEITFKANTRNTGPCTLNVDSLGAVGIKKDVDQDLATGDIKANQIVKVVYDGTNFQLIQGSGLIPTGGFLPFGAATAPAGYLLCDGSAVSRTTYAALFAVIGTGYGVGDGSTTFNVPNAKGKMIVGLDAAQTEFDTLAETGGAKTVTLTTTELPAHTHSLSGREPVSGSGQSHAQRTTASSGNDASVTTTTGSSGTGSAFSVMNPYLIANYIIKI